MSLRAQSLTYLPLFTCAVFAQPTLGQETQQPSTALTVGIDATLDAAAGLSGAGSGTESLHGVVMPYTTWQQTPDDQRALNLSGYLSLLWVEGRGPSGRIVGDYLAVDNSEAYESLRLFTTWLELGTERWSVRTGALLADDEFAGTTAGGELINSAFGWPAFISANALNGGPAYYVATLGLRIAAQNDDGWSARIGIYDGDAFDSPAGSDKPNRHGTHYQLNDTQGAFIIAETTYAPEDSPNRLLLGAWYHTADFADLGTANTHPGNYGAYAIIERTLAENVETHLRYGWAPDDRNEINWALDTALAFTGLLPGRNDDVLSLGYVHAAFSSAVPGSDYEHVLEMNYALILNDHFTIKPDLQYIMHPGGSNAADDALLFLLRVSTTY